jgi:hypothetical protein
MWLLIKSITLEIQHHIPGFIAAWVAAMKSYQRRTTHFLLKTITSTHLRREKYAGEWSYTPIISRNKQGSLIEIPCS